MDPIKVIGPIPRTTPTDLSARARDVLPEDLLRVSSRRLSIMCLLGAVLWGMAELLSRVEGYATGEPDWAGFGAPEVIAYTSLAVSLALAFYARRSRREPRFILNLGLGYLVFMALAVGVLSHWRPPGPHASVSPMVSWIGALVLMFAAIVPTTPTRTFVVGLFAVSMNPIGMLISRARGTWDFGPASNALLMHFPDYILVGAAVVIAHVVTRLGREVSRARELGSYSLGELLGRGGMGEIYEATHRMLARPAAIKLIRPEMLGGGNADAARTALVRFRREAEAAAHLRSPHTVELYDFGVTENQTLYFVMELLDGMDLEALVHDHGPLPAGRTIYLLRQVCDSLDEAHARGMVHRDIKPANIHVGRLGLHHDWVKVLDFGLVKTTSVAAVESTNATAAGLMVGTPAYMAPEMALGVEIDGRADLYALGCVAYFLLTGETVFTAGTSVQMIALHLHEAPVAPSRRTELPVPEALDRLILECLAKDPRARPASARILATRLAELQAEPWGEEQAERWWRAHRPSRTSGSTGDP